MDRDFGWRSDRHTKVSEAVSLGEFINVIYCRLWSVCDQAVAAEQGIIVTKIPQIVALYQYNGYLIMDTETQLV